MAETWLRAGGRELSTYEVDNQRGAGSLRLGRTNPVVHKRWENWHRLLYLAVVEPKIAILQTPANGDRFC